MKQAIAFITVCAFLILAIARAEIRKDVAPVGPQAIIHFVGDAEYEVAHLPMLMTRLSDEEEVRVGNVLARKTGGVSAHRSAEEEETAVYIGQVGERLASQAHRRLPYKFHYVRSRQFANAYALPGGHVYIGAGLLQMMETEDELAAVLGHEIEHVDHYHCAERAQTEAILRHIPLGDIVAIPVQTFQAGYSKDQEFEADREGTLLAVRAGYSPNGSVRLFEELEKLEDKLRRHEPAAQTPLDEGARVAQQSLEEYFMSHPPAHERLDQINQLIRANGWGKLPTEKPLGLPTQSEKQATPPTNADE